MLTGEVKKRLIGVLTELVERHQRARAAVTDEVSFMPFFLNHLFFWPFFFFLFIGYKNRNNMENATKKSS